MLRPFAAVLLLFSLSAIPPAAAFAAQAGSLTRLIDYDARLPDEIVHMQRAPDRRITRDDKRLVVRYGEARDEAESDASAQSAARGTVFILPAAQASGVNASARAQVAMLDATVDSLRRGTTALGPDYSTGLVRTSTLRVDEVALMCATLLRRQAPEAGDLQLVDQRCFYEVPGYLLGVTTSTPFRAPDEQATREDQMAFIMGIVRALGGREPAPE